MNKRETHIVTGMTRDLFASRFDNKFVVDARNIRITSTKNNATLLSVTNEKGTGEFSVTGTIEGVILGHAVLNKTLVLFTTEHTTSTNADPIPDGNGLDRIYRLDFSDDFDSATATLLFEGNLNLYYKNPLETLPYYETDSIQKVYWVDGRNQPRMINIENGFEENEDVFNFNRRVDGNHTFTVIKHNTGGEFPAGTIQYCFNYFNKFGQETNIVDVSPLYYLCPQDKGLPADGVDTSSFEITIKNADIHYEYVRVYAIIRTSENATPYARIVGDYKIELSEELSAWEEELILSPFDFSDAYIYDINTGEEVLKIDSQYQEPSLYNGVDIPLLSTQAVYLESNGYLYSGFSRSTGNKRSYITIFNDDGGIHFIRNSPSVIIKKARFGGESKSTTIIDNGTVGSTIDSQALLFIGGQDIIAGTLSSKDNTLFLGNIKQNVPSIGTLMVGSSTLKESIRGKAAACAFDYSGTEISEFSIDNDDNNVSEEFYDYVIDNNRSSYLIKSFKARENYRLGIIAQYYTGQWSEVLWVDDLDETIAPGINLFSRQNSIVSWGKSYHRAGFKAVLTPDIVNVLRGAGFIRVAPVVIYPNNAERKVLYQGILTSTVYNVKDRSTNSPYAQADWRFRLGYNWTNIENEIQTNFGPRHGSLPIVNSQGGNAINKNEFVDLFSTEFYRDSNILTFYSPDLENLDSYSTVKNLKLRIVGFSNAGFDSNNEALLPKSKVSYYVSTENSGFYNSASVLDGPVDVNGNDSLLYPGYQDLPVQEFQSEDYISEYGILREKSIGYPDFWGEMDRFFVSSDIWGTRYTYQHPRGNSLVKWYTYLWHRSGSLNNQPKLSSRAASLNTVRTANLKKKCVAEFKYGRTTFLQGEVYNGVGPDRINVERVESITPFSSDIMSLQMLGTSNKTYYGNIDKVIIPAYKDIPTGYYDPFTGEPVEWEYGIFGYPIGFDSYEKIYKNGDEYDYSPADMPKYATVIYKYPNVDRPLTPGDAEETDGFFGDDPVVMKYRSTNHAIIKLYSDDDDLYTFGQFGPYSTYLNAPLFWDNNNDISIRTIPVFDSATIISNNYSGIDNGIYIGELYQDFSTEEQQGRFGGTSDAAIINGVWNRCGESVPLNNGIVTIYYREGDTYVGRYDFLKTYPVSEEDINQVISIYSTEIESRVNLDARYDKMRGLLNNVFVRPENFNLFNHLGYEQTNQFFTFKAIDYDRYKSLNHPNLVTFTTEKKPGADIDAWTSIPMTATFDLKGELGEITKLIRGVAQILFNERVQIPTSDGQPIEITNGLKFGGYRYLSDQIGMTNKWSLQTTPNGVYFIDDEKNTLYHFGGQQFQDLSGKAGFRTWLAENNSYDVWNPVEYGNFKTWYDRVNGDLYFMNKDESLVYSEQIGNFISFMDYGKLPLFVNMNDRFLSAKYDSTSGEDTIWELWAGQYNMFFGQYRPYWLTFISNTDPTTDKIFNNLSWRTFDYNSEGDLQPLATFDTVRVWNDHQDTGEVSLVDTKCKPTNLKKKFNVFRALVPRDGQGVWKGKGMNRIRSVLAYIKLSRNHPNVDKMIFGDFDVDFFE